MDVASIGARTIVGACGAAAAGLILARGSDPEHRFANARTRMRFAAVSAGCAVIVISIEEAARRSAGSPFSPAVPAVIRSGVLLAALTVAVLGVGAAWEHRAATRRLSPWRTLGTLTAAIGTGMLCADREWTLAVFLVALGFLLGPDPR